MRQSRRSAAIVTLVGIITLLPLMRRARFQAYHTVDVLQLLASGACFGAGMVLLFIRKPSA